MRISFKIRAGQLDNVEATMKRHVPSAYDIELYPDLTRKQRLTLAYKMWTHIQTKRTIDLDLERTARAANNINIDDVIEKGE